VLEVQDFLPNNSSIFLSNNDPSTGTPHTGYHSGDTTVIQRTCSADLAAPTAYAWTDHATRTFYGTDARIFQTGEESCGFATSVSGGGDLGPESRVDFGRQWNMILTDDSRIPGDQSRTAFEMPHCGLFAWEQPREPTLPVNNNHRWDGRYEPRRPGLFLGWRKADHWQRRRTRRTHPPEQKR
jgi:hypothetical protein